MVGGRCRIAIFLAVCLVKAHGITLEERVNHHLMKSAATGRATEVRRGLRSCETKELSLMFSLLSSTFLCAVDG